MKVGKRGTGKLGCAAAMGAMLALPAGYMLGRHSPQSSKEQPKEAASGKTGNMRSVYAPNFLSDPAVKDQHREIVEALELACVRQRLHCEEAASARRWLDKRDER